MKKQLLTLLFVSAIVQYSSAQNNNEMVVRLKYEDAETAYNSGNYSLVLTKLNEVDKDLGKQTPKTLYLRIMAQYKSLNYDVYGNVPLLQALKKNVAQYVKVYGGQEALADKLRDIYQIGEELKQYSDNPRTHAGIQALKGMDTIVAVNEFTKATNEGDAEAMRNLAQIAVSKEDYSKAMIMLINSADKGNAEAMLNIGQLYEWGWGVSIDGAKAVEWYTKAADNGKAEAMFTIGFLYAMGETVPQDQTNSTKWYIKAMESLIKAADKGDPHAMELIALMYADHRGVPEDQIKATEWYIKAANNGQNPSVMSDVGRRYEQGIGVTANGEKAIYWYAKAADKGYYFHYTGIGDMCMYGEGKIVPEDKSKAAEWYTKAAEKGEKDAMLKLGIAYNKGSGVPKDNIKAKEWFTKAIELFTKDADQGDAIAMISIALMYELGWSNGPKVIEWYSKAADHGSYYLMTAIGDIYLNGEFGIEKNKEIAIGWYRKAADKGEDSAKDKLKQLGIK